MKIKNAKKQFREAIDAAKDTLLLNSQVEITDNKHVLIQGAKGIMEYNDDSIKIKLNENEIEFFGEGLIIECLSQDSMELRGKISRIEYT